ncbi:GMC oxidoreductase [Sphaerobolus stellatus SS14]|uniref:GMC oxidoreductase n=1 Tax=Sphaerobolus stellatus (strain SS14) TaxID=990650 RepID=A0A0C9VQX5_SPHS4|nr:GMC oxidoreductase [Sphaerobolus stellatus SS14]
MRQDNDFIKSLIQRAEADQNAVVYDVFIAGSGPIASTYARTILDKNKDAKIYIAEVGSQDSAVPGAHLQNSLRFQKDSGSFAQMVKASLQPVSVPPNDTYQPTLARAAWSPSLAKPLFRELNLPAASVTRTVGGMGTHWGYGCPIPDEKELTKLMKYIPKSELCQLFKQAQVIFKVHTDQFDGSIRQKHILKIKERLYLQRNLLGDVPNNAQGKLPLAVERRTDNPRFVTWTGCDVILGSHVNSDHITLDTQSQPLRLIDTYRDKKRYIQYAFLRKLNHSSSSSKGYDIIQAKTFVVACGAIGTPQVLTNSGYSLDLPLGNVLSGKRHVSLRQFHLILNSFEVVLRRNIVDAMAKDPATAKHQKNYPKDPLPIPFNGPDPQLILPYSSKYPWLVQINRSSAFTYGEVGTQADPRIVLDLRTDCTDAYDMPQATFEVSRTDNDGERNQRWDDGRHDIIRKCSRRIPSYVTSPIYGTGSCFAYHGKGLGTTRIGKDKSTSVANGESKVHGFENLWIGGNGCIPDAMASNPTLTTSKRMATAGLVKEDSPNFSSPLQHRTAHMEAVDEQADLPMTPSKTHDVVARANNIEESPCSSSDGRITSPPPILLARPGNPRLGIKLRPSLDFSQRF